VLFLFIPSLFLRQEWFGEIAPGGHQWLSGHTLKAANQWYYGNPLHLGFGFIENPDSIEFNDLDARGSYASYPPGVIFPIYSLSILSKQPPSPTILETFNLANQFVNAILIAFIVFVVLVMDKKLINKKVIFIISLIAGAGYIYLPGPFYWHQNVFFADQAVIMYILLATLLEIFRDFQLTAKTKRILDLALFCTSLIGALTDWYYWTFLFFIMIKRVLTGELKPYRMMEKIHRVLLWSFPLLLSGVLFLGQIIYLGSFDQMLIKMLERSGLLYSLNIDLTVDLSNTVGLSSTDKPILLSDFWIEFLNINFTFIGRLVIYFIISFLFLYLLIYVFKKIRKQEVHMDLLLKYSYLITGPALLHFLLLSNHSMIHSFAALKMSLPLLIVGFAWLPIYIINNLHKILSPFLRSFFVFSLISATLIYYLICIPKSLTLFPDNDWELITLGKMVRDNTSVSDVVFSNFYEIPAIPPVAISYSNKRVYLVNSAADIETFIKTRLTDKQYRIGLLLNEKKESFTQIYQWMMANADYDSSSIHRTEYGDLYFFHLK
jgi:hypothetical protein